MTIKYKCVSIVRIDKMRLFTRKQETNCQNNNYYWHFLYYINTYKYLFLHLTKWVKLILIPVYSDLIVELMEMVVHVPWILLYQADGKFKIIIHLTLTINHLNCIILIVLFFVLRVWFYNVICEYILWIFLFLIDWFVAN